MANAILALVYTLLDIYVWLVVVYVIMSWLISFSIINTHHQFVRMIWDFLVRIVEPVTIRIRRVIPDLGGLDISPILLILIVYFVQRLMVEFFGPQITYL